MAQQLTAVL